MPSFYHDNDRLYLNSNERSKRKPKESFKFLYNKTKNFLSSKTKASILDVGCGRGDFLYYLHQFYPESKFSGIDYSSELLRLAKKEFPAMNCVEGDIYSGVGLPDNKYDVVFMSGVNGGFEEYKPWVNNLIQMTKKNGRVYLFGNFNPEATDVLVRVRKSGEEIYEPSYFNSISLHSIQLYLTELNLNHKVSKFEISIEIPKRKDPLRAYTIKLADGQYLEVVGIQQIIHQYLIEINV